MNISTGGNLALSREYHKKLFGPLFYPWWNCPLITQTKNKRTAFPLFLRKISWRGKPEWTLFSGLLNLPNLPLQSKCFLNTFTFGTVTNCILIVFSSTWTLHAISLRCTIAPTSKQAWRNQRQKSWSFKLMWLIRRRCHWMLAVSHHCSGSNPGQDMREGCQWLRVMRWFGPGTPVSSTTYKWLVMIYPWSGRKSVMKWLYKG